GVGTGAVEGALQVGGDLAIDLAEADVLLDAEQLRAAVGRRPVALLDAAARRLAAGRLRGARGGGGQRGAGGGDHPAHEGAAVDDGSGFGARAVLAIVGHDVPHWY